MVVPIAGQLFKLMYSIYDKPGMWAVLKMDTSDTKNRHANVKDVRFKLHNKPVVKRVKPEVASHYTSAVKRESFVMPTERMDIQSWLKAVELTPEERRHLNSFK
jgi:hypothetical protein